MFRVRVDGWKGCNEQQDRKYKRIREDKYSKFIKTINDMGLSFKEHPGGLVNIVIQNKVAFICYPCKNVFKNTSGDNKELLREIKEKIK